MKPIKLFSLLILTVLLNTKLIAESEMGSYCNHDGIAQLLSSTKLAIYDTDKNRLSDFFAGSTLDKTGDTLYGGTLMLKSTGEKFEMNLSFNSSLRTCEMTLLNNKTLQVNGYEMTGFSFTFVRFYEAYIVPTFKNNPSSNPIYVLRDLQE